MTLLPRRTFLRQSAFAAGSLALLGGTRSAARVVGANNRLRIAVAGLNGRGKAHIAGWLEQPNVEIAYLIDPDQRVLERTLKNVQERVQGRYTPQGVADVRKALADPNLDAISIAAPNHWHSLMTIWAAQAGKHVYVEKPMSHDVVEGRVVVAAQQKYGVVIQHGTQRRSDPKLANPVRVMALGGRFKWNDQGETPNTMFAIAEYPNGQQVFFNVRNVNHPGYVHQVKNEYYFEDGGRIVDSLYFAKGSAKGEKLDLPPGQVTPGGNWGSFIAACRAGKPEMANGNAAESHYASVLGHLMNNSYRLGRKVPFNAKAGRFGDNAAAAEHFLKLHEMMRDGAGVPENGAEYVVGPWLTFDPAAERHTGEFAAEANALLQDPNHKGFEIPSAAKV